jgi:hypothetical protein
MKPYDLPSQPTWSECRYLLPRRQNTVHVILHPNENEDALQLETDGDREQYAGENKAHATQITANWFAMHSRLQPTGGKDRRRSRFPELRKMGVLADRGISLFK